MFLFNRRTHFKHFIYSSDKLFTSVGFFIRNL